MTVESAADRAVFLADFGMQITWQVGAGAPAAITALYDGGALPQDMQAGGVVMLAQAEVRWGGPRSARWCPRRGSR